ncbi:MAG TPA: hypothetical protein VKY19_27765 [Ktedonosporobacter sp.]|nr:hypothetical protein [Ktedonosporobacter sp.]
MNTQQTAYEAPRLEVKQLRDMPSALACSGHNHSNGNNNHNNNNNHNHN